MKPLKILLPAVLGVAVSAFAEGSGGEKVNETYPNLLSSEARVPTPGAETSQGWLGFGDVQTESSKEGTPVLVARTMGKKPVLWEQTATLPASASDGSGFLALVGRVSNENRDRKTPKAGAPSISLVFFKGKIGDPLKNLGDLSYLDLDPNRSGLDPIGRIANRWETIWGISKVPAGAGYIRVFFQPGQYPNVPRNGAAVRLADAEVQIFPSETEAKEFVKSYQKKYRGSDSPSH